MASAAERMAAMRARRRAAKTAPEPPEVRIAPISDLRRALDRVDELEAEVKRLKRLLALRSVPPPIVDPRFGYSRPAPKVPIPSR